MHYILRCILVLQLMLTCGCAALVQEPRITLTRTVITGLDTSGASLECTLAISNPNPYDLSLLGYNYELAVMSLPLASGGAMETITVPAGKQADMRIPIRVKFGNLIEILKRQPDPERIPYKFRASLQLSTPLGDMSVPIERDDTFSVPENYRPDYYLDILRGMLPSRP